MAKFIKRIGGLCLFAYVAVLVIFFFLQGNFIYHPNGNYLGPEATSLNDMRTVQIRTDAGETLPAWWHPPETGEPVVIFFHGNASSAYFGRFIYEHLIQADFGVLGAEYPGYPGANGRPNQKSLTRAALAHYDFLIEQGVRPDDIYLIGNSLGTGGYIF